MKWFVGFLLALASAPVLSATSIANLKITRLATAWSGEGFYVDAIGTLPAGVDCGDGLGFILPNNATMQKEMVSTLLMAMQGQNPVDIYVVGCIGGRMQLQAVAIYPSK